MGAGKSSVGKILAEKLNRNFHDTDRIIEASTKKSISEIFASKGESYFRDREEEIVKKITSEVEEAVVALGGGAILRPTNWQVINRSGLTVYLKYTSSVLLNRLARDASSRPLVANLSPESYQTDLLRLFELRKPFYARADFIIDCSAELSETEVADKIFNRLDKRQ